MAETIGQLALRIADGMPECCNDENAWGRIYEFEPQELEAFARAFLSELDKRQQPFGYFRSTPFGWEDCAETDEGAMALYERPAAAVPEGWKLVPESDLKALVSSVNGNCYLGEERERALVNQLLSSNQAYAAQFVDEKNKEPASRPAAKRYRRWITLLEDVLKHGSLPKYLQHQTRAVIEQIEGSIKYGGCKCKKALSTPTNLEAAPASPAQGQEDDRKDAERYRWLRNRDVEKNFPRDGLFIGRIPENTVVTGEDADAAIDAAMAASKEGGADPAAQGSACHG